MANLSIENVVNVSVNQLGQGLEQYNTSNLALFTHEAFGEGFGSDGYKIYLSPTEVGEDFGTASVTYKMALSIFSQQPNILANNGYLVVIPMVEEVQLIDFSANPDEGSFKVNYDGNASASILYTDNAAQVQTKLRAVEGLEAVTVTGSITTTGLTVTLEGVASDPGLLTITDNTLEASNVPVTVTVSEVEGGETFDVALARTSGIVEYFGAMTTYIMDETETLDAADVIQAESKLAFFVQRDSATVEASPAGILYQLQAASLSHARGLFYGSDNDLEALEMMAAYAARGLSVNFTGNNTTLTMNLKTLIGILPDPSMTQTLKTKCDAAGADIYASIQGTPKVLSFGANEFFDDIYNLLWFVGQVKINLFNILAQTGTKIPQTENGMSTLKSGVRSACVEGVNNQFIAPGSWTSPTTFGNQVDFLENIAQVGYYIWSKPVSQQQPSDREDRIAPLIQVAIKYAGAIHKVNVIVNINK